MEDVGDIVILIRRSNCGRFQDPCVEDKCRLLIHRALVGEVSCAAVISSLPNAAVLALGHYITRTHCLQMHTRHRFKHSTLPRCFATTFEPKAWLPKASFQGWLVSSTPTRHQLLLKRLPGDIHNIPDLSLRRTGADVLRTC